MKKLETLIFTFTIFFGMKQKPQENCRQIYLPNGEKVMAPPKPERILIAYSVIPAEAMNYMDWFTYVRLRPDIDPEGPTITKFYL